MVLYYVWEGIHSVLGIISLTAGFKFSGPPHLLSGPENVTEWCSAIFNNVLPIPNYPT